MKRDIVKKSLITPILLTILLISARPVYAQWTVTTFPDPNDLSFWLLKIDFIDSNEGWALGVGSVLLHYLNGTWTTSQLPDINPANRQLSDIQFISRDEGWAVGSIQEYSEGHPQRGVIYHYINGGWTAVNLPDISPNWSLSSIQFFSPNEGWAAGADSSNHKVILLQYINGQWKTNIIDLQYRSPTISGMFFTSSNEGWIVGNFGTRGFILHYLNGKWKTTGFPFNWQLTGGHFVSPNEGWVVGIQYYGGFSHNKGLLLHYLNGRWRSIGPPYVSSYWYLTGVHFISPNEGWAVGNSEKNNGVLLHYLNGSWTLVDVPILESYFSDVQFISSNEGWVAGNVVREHHLGGNILSGLLLKYSSP